MSFGISGYNRPYSYAGSAGSAGGAGSAGASGSAANAGSAGGVGSSSGAGSTSASGSASGTKAILGKDSSSTSRSTVTYAASIKVYDDSNVADAIEAAMRGEIGSAGAMDNVANYLGSLGFTGSLGSMGDIRNFLGSTALGSLASSVPYDPAADYDNDYYGENNPNVSNIRELIGIGNELSVTYLRPSTIKQRVMKALNGQLGKSNPSTQRYVQEQSFWKDPFGHTGLYYDNTWRNESLGTLNGGENWSYAYRYGYDSNGVIREVAVKFYKNGQEV